MKGFRFTKGILSLEFRRAMRRRFVSRIGQKAKAQNAPKSRLRSKLLLTARHRFDRIGLSLALVRLPRRHIERGNTEPAALFRLAPILLYHYFGDCQDLLSLFE